MCCVMILKNKKDDFNPETEVYSSSNLKINDK